MKTSFTTDELRTRLIDALGITRPETLAAIQTMNRERLEGMLENLEGKPAARTEAKVSGEVVSNLRVWWVDGQLLYDGVEDETYRDSDHSEDVAVVILKDLKDALQLPAQQSSVVPGVEELKRVYLDGFDYGSELDPIDDGIKRIHAHLLANARESREGMLREALVKARDYIEDGSPLPDVNDPYWSAIEAIDKALATVGKEG